VTEQAPLQISDTLTTVAFSGPEYVIPPGAEGVASLVFDVPKHARGVKGGTREGAEGEDRLTEALFEVRCNVGIKIAMGIGRCTLSSPLLQRPAEDAATLSAKIFTWISLW
jgi:hypothetical protein